MTVTDQTKLLLSEAGGGNFIISEIVKAYKLFFIFLIKGEVCIYLYYLREFCFPFSWGNQIFLFITFYASPGGTLYIYLAFKVPKIMLIIFNAHTM